MLAQADAMYERAKLIAATGVDPGAPLPEGASGDAAHEHSSSSVEASGSVASSRAELGDGDDTGASGSRAHAERLNASGDAVPLEPEEDNFFPEQRAIKRLESEIAKRVKKRAEEKSLRGRRSTVNLRGKKPELNWGGETRGENGIGENGYEAKETPGGAKGEERGP